MLFYDEVDMSQEGREIAHALSWLVEYTFGVIISLIIVYEIVYEIVYHLTKGVSYAFDETTSFVGSMTVFELFAIFFVAVFIFSGYLHIKKNENSSKSNSNRETSEENKYQQF